MHADSDATKAAKSINAKAFTIGNHIVFGEGQFAQGTYEGQKLLAHELTHTIQQQGAAKIVHSASTSFSSSAADSFLSVQDQNSTSSVMQPKNIIESNSIISRSGIQLARDTLDAGVSNTHSTTVSPSSADQVKEALSKVDPTAGIGDFPEAFNILQGLPMRELFTTLNELDLRYQYSFIDSLKFNIGAAKAGGERIEAAILVVTYRNHNVLSDSDVVRVRALISALDPADQGAIESFAGEQNFQFLKGEWTGGESDFIIHAGRGEGWPPGKDDFIISFIMSQFPSATEADGLVVISPVHISEAFRGGERASPFQQKVKFYRPNFNPVLLQQSLTERSTLTFPPSHPEPSKVEKGGTVWTFDWDGDKKPDFNLRIEYSISDTLREYNLTTGPYTTSQTGFHFIQLGGVNPKTGIWEDAYSHGISTSHRASRKMT